MGVLYAQKRKPKQYPNGTPALHAAILVLLLGLLLLARTLGSGLGLAQDLAVQLNIT